MAGASLLLAGCNHDAFVNPTPFRIGEWGIDPQTDRVTGAPISNSLLVTNRVSHRGILFPPPARLQLLCFKPGHEPRARIVNGYLSVLIDDPYEVKQFVGEMATSDVLYLGFRSLTATGRTSAEFKVTGAAPAIAAAYASCPLTATAPAPCRRAPFAMTKKKRTTRKIDGHCHRRSEAHLASGISGPIV